MCCLLKDTYTVYIHTSFECITALFIIIWSLLWPTGHAELHAPVLLLCHRTDTGNCIFVCVTAFRYGVQDLPYETLRPSYMGL
jgi:hypothetical protein